MNHAPGLVYRSRGRQTVFLRDEAGPWRRKRTALCLLAGTAALVVCTGAIALPASATTDPPKKTKATGSDNQQTGATGSDDAPKEAKKSHTRNGNGSHNRSVT